MKLSEIINQFQENRSESEYGLQIEASVSVPLDITIYHVPILDTEGNATGKFTDKCVLEISCGFNEELRGVTSTLQGKKGTQITIRSDFLSGVLHYNNDPTNEHGVYLEDILAALYLNEIEADWTIQEAE